MREVLAVAHLAQHAARDAVIEEQAGIEIVGQVDPQLGVILFHQQEFAFLRQFLVLVLTLLPLAGFQDQLIRRQFQHRQRRVDHIEQALTRFCASTVFGGAYSCTTTLLP